MPPSHLVLSGICSIGSVQAEVAVTGSLLYLLVVLIVFLFELKLCTRSSHTVSQEVYWCIYSKSMNVSVFIMVLITTLVAMIYYSFIPFLSPGLLGDNCHAGWIGGFQDRCFKIVETRSTWAQAKGICKDIGGELTILDSRSEEHTSELQSPCNLVCRLLLEKKKKKQVKNINKSSCRVGIEDWEGP